MKQKFKLAILLSVVLVSQVQSQDYSDIAAFTEEGKELESLIKARTWEDSTATHKTRARFAGFNLADNSVVLRKLNGDKLVVSRDKLGKEENDCISRIVELRLKLDSELIATLEHKNKKLVNEIKELQDTNELEKKAMLAKIQRLAVFAPDDSLNDAAGIPIVTAKRLEALGSSFVGKTVIMNDCRFNEISSSWVDDVGGSDRYTGFDFLDSEGDFYQFGFAPREKFAEFLLSLKDDQRIAILGTVVNLGGDRYGIIASKIEKRK